MDGSSHVRPAIAAVGLSAVVVSSIPGLSRAFLGRKRNPPPGSSSSVETGAQGYLYEDADGKANEKSVKSYSDRWPRIAAWMSAGVGLGMATTALILLSTRPSYSSYRLSSFGLFNVVSDVACWACICLQCAGIPTKFQYQERYRLAVYGLVSSVVLLASLVARFGPGMLHIATSPRSSGVVLAVGLSWLGQMVAAVTAALSFASYPQRPDVYLDNGHLVDQQHTASLLQRLTYSWNGLVFRLAKERQLEAEDMPELDDKRRSSSVLRRFLSWEVPHAGNRLWRRLVQFHVWQLAQQWALAFSMSVFALFPQVVLYNFLEILDQSRRGPEPGTNLTLVAWVVALFASLLLQVWASNFMRWLTSSRLEDPVLSLLQSLVFRKAMRLREVSAPPKKAAENGDEASNNSAPSSSGDALDGKTADARQSVVNHMKLDTGRVVMAASYSFYFPVALFKLILAGSFLAELVGWKPVVAGLTVAVCLLPISQRLSKKYGKIQFGLMRFRDGKAHLIEEALQGIRQIKMSALETFWEGKILESRNEELAQFWRVSLWTSLISLVLNIIPMMMATVTLSVYAFTTKDGIKASVVFASIGLLDQLDDAIGWLPILQVYLTESWTSCTRLEKFFGQPEMEPIASAGDHISFENAAVAWHKFEEVEGESADPQESSRSMLKEITLDFPNSELSIVTGKTGSGKSLLLAAILGEVKLVSGQIRVPPPPKAPEESGAISGSLPSSLRSSYTKISDEDWIIPSLTAFVSQNPWLEGRTLRENILFGLPLNSRRYSKVLAACALGADLEQLKDGDETQVGPRGVILSGGQRWRVALARALYSRAGIILLDDVLSAIDAHTGRIIVDQALSGELARGRTRILATHHAEMCLPKARYLVRLVDGRMESAEPLAMSEEDLVDDGSSMTVAGDDHSPRLSSATTPILGTPEDSDAEDDNSKPMLKKNKAKAGEEKRETGRVKWKVYRDYIKAGRSFLLWALALVLIISTRFILVGRTWALKEVSQSDPPVAAFATNGFVNWQRDGSGDLRGLVTFASQQNLRTWVNQQFSADGVSSQQSVAFWMGAYILLGLLSVAISISRSLIFTVIGLRTAKTLFERMTFTILRAPLRWLDTTPRGVIMNRCLSDMFTVDRRIAAELGGSLHSVLAVVTVIAASLTVSKWVNLAGLVLMVFYVRVAMQYIGAARDIKRINSVVWSPIYDSFQNLLGGLSTIRGFQRENFYVQRMHQLIDTATKTSWALTLCQRWMAFRMGAIGVLFVSLVAGAIAFSRIDAALAGFSLTFALQYTAALTTLLSSVSSIELVLNAAERVLEYCDLETEDLGGDDAPAAWPTRGEIEVENVTVSYAEGLPPVLKDLNFTVKPGERVGIVGRTGAGKSTLASVLFRLLKPQEGGCVRIDNIDISKVKLSQLRSRLAIIPQDPFLFSGTLRKNLDMEGKMDDAELLAALERVNLVKRRDDAANTEAVSVADERDAFRDLSMPISTGGTNLSQGQRQLVCLARAMLVRPKILLLDEATSSVDQETDRAIQESLREEFVASGCTVLVIAHRLSTIADFDKVIVLNEGRVNEMGAPADLVRRGEAAADRKRSDPEPEHDQQEDADGATVIEERDAKDGTGAFWELVQRSAERDLIMQVISGRTTSAA